MKNKYLLLTNLMFCFLYASGQPDDRQWLIWNTYGWDGTTYSYNPTTLGNQFGLQGIPYPDTSEDPMPRRDLFIIYSDGEHFNSRTEPNPGFFYPTNPDYTGASEHNFTNMNKNGSVSYMYMTNRYEVDEPPRSMMVSNGHLSSDVSLYETNVTKALLSANHDVAFTRDITIIVNYDSIMNSDFSPLQLEDSKTKLIPGDLVLKYDGIKHVSDGSMEFGLDYFDLKNVFDYGTAGSMIPGYPLNSYDTSAAPIRQVALNQAKEKYRYINLRTNDNAYQYGPDKNGETQDSAVFTLYKMGVPVAMLTEPIVHSHDPNFLQVEKICRLDDGSHLVYYMIEFENTSSTPTPSDGPALRDGLSVSIDFPPMFDLTCLEKTGWFAGGHPCSIRIKSPSANRREFEFKQESQLVNCNPSDTVQCIGRIMFKVRVFPGIDVTDPRINLMLDNILVYFGHASFEIHDFYDIKECEKVKGDPNENIKEPEAEVNDPEKEAKKHLTKNSQGHDNYSDSNNQMAHDPQGYKRCFRPLSEGHCRCHSGKFPDIPSLIIGLAIGAAIMAAVTWLIRRNKIPVPRNNPTPQPPQGN